LEVLEVFVFYYLSAILIEYINRKEIFSASDEIYLKKFDLRGSESDLNLGASRQWIKKFSRFIDSYIVFYRNPKYEVCRFENDETTRLRRADG
jgi:hypothetical protein